MSLYTNSLPFWVTEKQKKWIVGRAGNLGISMSQLIRNIIDEEAKRHGVEIGVVKSVTHWQTKNKYLQARERMAQTKEFKMEVKEGQMEAEVDEIQEAREEREKEKEKEAHRAKIANILQRAEVPMAGICLDISEKDAYVVLETILEVKRMKAEGKPIAW